MSNVDTTLEGHRAHARLERMLRHDVPIDRDQLVGLIAKMGAAIVVNLPDQPEPGVLPAGVTRGFAPVIHRGGRP